MSQVVTLSADERAVVAAFWWQRVYFDGVPTRRWEVVPRLAVTPGLTEGAALSLLLTAEVADASLVHFAGDDLDPDGRWITVAHQHTHLDKAGAIDGGGGPHVRKMLGQQTVGDRVRGAVGKVKTVAKRIGKKAGKVYDAVERAEGRLNDAVERGSEKAAKYLKEKGKAGVAKAKELVKKYAPVVKDKVKKYGKLAAKKGLEYGVKGAKIAGKKGLALAGAAARRVGAAVKGGLAALWAKLKGGAKVGVKVAGKAAGKLARNVKQGVKDGVRRSKAGVIHQLAHGKPKAAGGENKAAETEAPKKEPPKEAPAPAPPAKSSGDSGRKKYSAPVLKSMTKKLLGGKGMVVLNSPKGGHKIRNARDLREYLRAGGKLPGRLRSKPKAKK